MALADVLAATTIDPAFSAADRATVINSVTTAYNGSATARSMFDNWIAGGKTIQVDHGANQFRAFLNTGRIEIDLAFLQTVNFIDNNGRGHNFLPVSAITHEFVHAILGLSDNFNSVDYKGDTVTRMNTIETELGIPLRNSYIGANLNTIITDGFEYTNGAAIDRSQAADNNFNSSPAGNSRDLLIGGPSANVKQSGDGDDVLFGGGGNDTLNGGNGTDTGVLTAKPVDYDVRLNADGTWAVRHVRGAANEGNDTWSNLERIQFEGGQSFNLAKNGLSFQTDYAFVVDQTGSMGDDIAAVQATATSIIDALFNNNTLDTRVGVVGFRDNTIGEPTQVLLSFTDQDAFADRKAAAQAAINALGASGGGDFPETAFDGLLKALDGTMGDWREVAGTKRVVLFTDASAKDAFLAPTVAAFAANIGATISSGTTSALGTVGAIHTFKLATSGSAASIFPTDDEDPPFVPDDTPVTPPGGAGTVQIFTIFVDDFIDPDPNLATVSEDSGGGVFLVDDPTDLVETLTALIESANYSLTVNPASVVEGDSGTTDFSFTLSRDRTDEASTVTLETRGTAGPSDVTGAPTTLDFAIGESSKTFTVKVAGDTIDEDDETFGLEITDITENATVGTTPIVSFTILDDDEPIDTVFDSVSLSLGGNRFRPTLTYREDGEVQAAPRQIPLLEPRDPGDAIPISISAIDSDDFGSGWFGGVRQNFTDRVTTSANGFGIVDGDDLFNRNALHVDGDEVLVFAFEDDAPFDFAAAAEISFGRLAGNASSVVAEAFLEGLSVGEFGISGGAIEIPDGAVPGIDRIEVRSDGNAAFTVKHLEFFDLFEVDALLV